MWSWENSLVLQPIGITIENHHVKDPLAPLFFGLDQAERLQVEQVTFDEVNLRLAHAATLQVKRDARQVRRGGLTFLWSRIAIAPSELASSEERRGRNAG